MTTVAFFVRQFSERGTEVSTFDYAHFNETLLGNKSIIISLQPDVLTKNNLPFIESVYKRFAQRFQVVHVSSFNELSRLIKQLKVDVFYTLTHGGKESFPFAEPDFEIKSVVHCVFNTKFPQGTIYSAVSDAVNEANQTKYPVVPHIVYLPNANENLRAQLNIPDDAIVFGRYGGYTQFDIQFVREAVIETALNNKNIFFLFMNTEPFGAAIPNIKFLPAQIDLTEKRKFINTCDAHIHARADGETFGLACGEFAVCMKPIITYKLTDSIAHIKILKEKAVLYENKNKLMKIFAEFYRGKYNMDGNGYLNYSPEKVMDKFNEVFILSENKKNYSSVRIYLTNKLNGLRSRVSKLF